MKTEKASILKSRSLSTDVKSRQHAISQQSTGKVAGIFLIADQIRGNAAESLAEMRENGIKENRQCSPATNNTRQELVAGKAGH
ncbi:hypothetical protein [Lentibacillus sp. CBA3610]|uniref:hypothetical protein n=1 Tax=Lentibacillus sp. CBA3610 TaxID=2518176 RepID=UPI001595B86E|nr:hypothetical protein [Lentibacillus sp. CBA3610]